MRVKNRPFKAFCGFPRRVGRFGAENRCKVPQLTPMSAFFDPLGASKHAMGR